MYSQIDAIKKLGFTGFKTIKHLWNDYRVVPDVEGVYVVLNPDCIKKSLLSKGVGGFFKGRDPNVPVSDLSKRWVENCHVLYFGKAGGGPENKSTLRSRLKLYLDFGKGKPVGHSGGRYIWQLSHHPELIVAWKETPEDDPRKIEGQLIKEFEDFYGKLPFANIVR
ncbi:MAG TPA: hypothetical protein VK772_07905 [Puia sp.]|nr:hypothetical protein [Puia sp.]